MCDYTYIVEGMRRVELCLSKYMHACISKFYTRYVLYVFCVTQLKFLFILSCHPPALEF